MVGRDARGHGHGRVRHGDVFEVDRADPFTAGLDHVLAAVGDDHVALGAELGHVAGGEPAVLQRVAAFTLEVGRQDPGPAHIHVTGGRAVPGQFDAVFAHDLHVHAVDRAALRGHHRQALFGRLPHVRRLECGDRADRAHLGHAPGVDHLHVVVVEERLDHRRRAGRAADGAAAHGAELQAVGFDIGQQPLPYRGHAGRERHLLGFEEFVQRLAVQPRAGEDELGASHRRHVDQAPGVDVEHRHHRQDAVLGRGVEHVGRGADDGVQHRAAVAVEHALGVARGARGVAQAGGGVLVEAGPLITFVLSCQQVFVAHQPGHLGGVGGHVLAPGHGDEMLDRLDA